MKAGKLIAAVFVGFSGALLACATILGFEEQSLEVPDAAGPDTGEPDVKHLADTGPCGYEKPFFRAPEYVDVGYGGLKIGAWLSSDEKRIYFGGYDAPGKPAKLYVATRGGDRGPFAPAQPLACCGVGSNEHSPTLIENERERVMVFAASVDSGPYDLFVTRWVDASNGFGGAKWLSVNQPASQDWAPFLSSGQKPKLWFAEIRGSNWDIYVAPFATDGSVGNPATPARISEPTTQEDNPVLNANGDNIYFSSSRQGGKIAVWVAHRDNLSDDLGSWNTPVRAGVPEVDAGDEQRPLWISPDECRLYYMVENKENTYRQIYMVDRKP